MSNLKEPSNKLDMNVILHFSNWNDQDRYYEVSEEILQDFKVRIEKDGMSEAWKWWHDLIDYDNTGKLPVQYGEVNMNLDQYFLDYHNPIESVNEWEF